MRHLKRYFLFMAGALGASFVLVLVSIDASAGETSASELSGGVSSARFYLLDGQEKAGKIYRVAKASPAPYALAPRSAIAIHAEARPRADALAERKSAALEDKHAVILSLFDEDPAQAE